MLRRAAASVLGPHLARCSAAAASSYATHAPPQDYALAMHKAGELSGASVVKPNKAEIGLCAGNPIETYKRPWRIAFDTTGKWENQLIGWTSTADPLENVGRASLFFYTKEEAIAFCDKYGWEYSVEDPNPRPEKRSPRFNSYGDNFSIKRNGVPDLSHMATRATY